MALRILSPVAGRSVARGVAVACCHAVASMLTIRYSRMDGGVAFVWIANAILLAHLLVTPRRAWLLVSMLCFAGGTFAGAAYGIGLPGAPFTALANITEPLLAAILLRRLGRSPAAPQSLADVLVFVAVAGGVAPALSAVAGAGVVTLATDVGFARNCLHWYLGHAIGALALTPIAVLVLSGELSRKLREATRRCRIETAGLILLNGATVLMVFGQARYPLLFLPMLPVIISAFRLGQTGAAASISIIVCLGGWLTARGSGPILLIAGSPAEHVEFFQFYVLIAALLALPVSAELQRRAALFRALQESEARYRLIAERSGDIIFTMSPDGEMRYVSSSIAGLGYDPAELVGTRSVGLIPDEDAAAAWAVHQRALAAPDDTQLVETRLRAADGRLIWHEAHVRGVVDDSGKVIGVVSATRDISRRKAIEQELTIAATTDPLTGLANRRTFMVGLERRLEQVRAGEGIGACAIFDLDLFKRINDRHGHDAGDRVLRAVGRVACDAVRGTDLVGRIGGEEFGILLWATDLASARTVCDRLRRRIAEMVVRSAEDEPIEVTISIGIAAIDGDADPETVLRAADAALYAAKSAGRNRLMLAA